MTRNKKTLIVLFILLTSGVVFWGFYRNSQNITPPSTPTATPSHENTPPVDNSSPLTLNEELAQQNMQTSDSKRPEAHEPTKTPTPSAQVNQVPLIYTGYGHNQLKPLPIGQSTSTTCTTDAQTQCQLTFTEQNSNVVVQFEAMETDQDGVARWVWIGGQKIGTGTWGIVATAGDKKSDKEIIYVE